MTLKQSQRHQIYNEHVDPEQGYNPATFEKYHFNSVKKKETTLKGFFKQGNM